MRHSYSIEEFKKAVEESYSIAQALTKLGLSPRGGNYRVFKKFEKLYIELEIRKGELFVYLLIYLLFNFHTL